MKLNLVLIFLFIITPIISLSETTAPSSIITYKKIQGGDLKLHVFSKLKYEKVKKRPAIIFFFGGGWTGGHPKQFYPHCEFLSEKGMLAISAEYRTQGSHGTTPFQCVEDGKSAIRWVRENAAKLKIDPNKIIAAGGSAGGHVAACSGIINGFETGNSEISSKPQALILFNPVCDTSSDGYGQKKIGNNWKKISPIHNVSKETPPTCIFHGTADTTVPLTNAEEFQKKIREEKIKCELHTYKDEKHGFFNYGRGNGSAYNDTTLKMKLFLESQGLLDKEDS